MFSSWQHKGTYKNTFPCAAPIASALSASTRVLRVLQIHNALLGFGALFFGLVFCSVLFLIHLNKACILLHSKSSFLCINAEFWLESFSWKLLTDLNKSVNSCSFCIFEEVFISPLCPPGCGPFFLPGLYQLLPHWTPGCQQGARNYCPRSWTYLIPRYSLNIFLCAIPQCWAWRHLLHNSYTWVWGL